jgi:hypothetical protein
VAENVLDVVPAAVPALLGVLERLRNDILLVDLPESLLLDRIALLPTLSDGFVQVSGLGLALDGGLLALWGRATSLWRLGGPLLLG